LAGSWSFVLPWRLALPIGYREIGAAQIAAGSIYRILSGFSRVFNHRRGARRHIYTSRQSFFGRGSFRRPARAAKTGGEWNMKRIPELKWALIWALAPLLGGCATIHKSADAGDLDKVDQLLEKGVAVDARDEFGRTPLMWATGDLDVVRHLADRGADIDARDANGETALMKAAFVGNLDVVKYLVQRGADVNARSVSGRTPLMRAAGNLDVVKFLVAQGADVNAQDANGDTALRWAATFGNLGVVKYLVRQGADANAADHRGQTPLGWARAFGHGDVVDYLEQKREAADAGADEGKSPRQNAAEETGSAGWLLAADAR